MSNNYRSIYTELDNDELIVDVPGLGYRLHYKIKQTTVVDSVTEYKEDDYPDFSTVVNLEFIRVESLVNNKSRKQTLQILKKISIIPSNLNYDHILLGFVYTNKDDPNNYRWWLDFRDSDNNSVYNYYTDEVEIKSSITTKAWHDEDPDGIWHGRFVLDSSVKILEPKIGRLVITGKKNKGDEKEDISLLPKKTTTLRLRYNIREDIWFCDILDKKNNELETIPCKSIICDAKMIGNKSHDEKPKVSTLIKKSDILNIRLAINSLIIRGR